MTKLATTIATLAATLTLTAATADAGRCGGGGGGHWRPAPTPTVRPITYPTPAPTVQWLFGMSVQTVQTQYGTGLQITQVSPNGAARRAGLEPGDILITSNGIDFRSAQSNRHGVQLLQMSMNNSQSPQPTVTGVSTQVVPAQQPGVALVQVIDSRTGQVRALYVYPQNTRSGFPEAPAPTAAVTF